MRTKTTITALLALFPGLAIAQESGEAAPVPGPSPVPAAPEPGPVPVKAAEPPPVAAAQSAPAASAPVTFGWEALVDTYYLYNFTGDPKTQGPRFRAFDYTANNFALNYAKLGVHADTEYVSFRMDIGGGHMASTMNGQAKLASAAGGPDTDSLYGNGFFVQQAFATVRPTSRISIDAGRFVTSVSAEVVETNKNWLYSRSLLFYALPAVHTGLRINAALLGTVTSPELVAAFHLVNGWNNDPDINSDKTFGLSVAYTPAGAGLTASLCSYVGKEIGGEPTRILVDGVFLKDIGTLSVGANIDYLKLGSAYFIGVAGMGRYIINDLFNVALRAEYLKSKDGAYAPTVDGSVYEVTAMGAWTMDKHYELRLEFRADMSDKEIFVKGATPRKNQVTGLVAALAYF
jgi:hypothetical protein